MGKRGQAWVGISPWIAAIFALSCGGETRAPQTAKRPASETPADELPPAQAEPRPDSADDQGPREGESTMTKTAAQPRELEGAPGSTALSLDRLLLPQNESFLKARLPEKIPGRYQTWRQQTSIHVGQSHLGHTSFVEDDRSILVQSSAEGSIRVYDRKTRKLIAKHDLVTGNPDRAFVLPVEPLRGSGPAATSYFALAGDSGVDLHEVRSGRPVAKLATSQARELLLSADGSILMARGTSDKGKDTLSFFERTGPTSLALVGQLSVEERLDAWDLSRDNRLLASVHYPSDDLIVRDLHTGRLVARMNAPKYAASVAFSPDGRWVAVGGKGLLLVDLVNPARRAFYSYVYNNINTVRFSPSGDAIAISSYDGHIRLLGYDGSGPTLELLRSLRHSGRANVYRIQFDEEGNSLVSGSGDQTVRVFGGRYQPTSRLPERDEFKTLEEWSATASDEEKRTEPPPSPSMRVGHYHPPRLDSDPLPCRIVPGKYACRVSSMYKLRDCSVTKTAEGHTMLEFHDGNLLELEGVLYDDGPVVRYEAWETNSGSVIACEGCEKQPIHAVFRGSGGTFTGLLVYRPYYDPYSPPPLPDADVKFEEAEDRFPLTLSLRFASPNPPLPTRDHSRSTIDPRLMPMP